MSDASKTFVTPFPGMEATRLINMYIRLHNLNAPATMSDAQKPFAGIESGHIVNQHAYLEEEKVKEEVKQVKEEVKQVKEEVKQVKEEVKQVKEEMKEPVANGLEKLPINFIQEEWVICDVCLGEIDSDNKRCIIRITKCGDIMHLSCFKKWKEYFLSKAENHDKTCCPCPSCRGECCY